MTQEEIIKHLHEALNSVDITFPYRYVLVEAIEALSQPSLPSVLDEAAINYAYDGEPEKYGIEFAESNGNNLRDDKAAAFKAGAEWMAGQGETIEGTLGYGPHLQRPIIMLEGVPKFYDGHSQEVIVNIRKA